MVIPSVKQGFKKTDLGIIPEDWEVKSIGGEIDLKTGFPFPSNKYTSTGIRLLRGSNIKRGKTDWSEEITEYWEKVTFELEPYVLNEGDIVIAMDGSLVGRSFARLSKQDLPALLLQRVARIRSNRIDMGYLKEYICSDYFTRYCDSIKTVTAIPHISPEDIRKFPIPIPPTKEEQFAIAKILSEADVLTDSLDKLIEKKKNIKQGAMQKLLTGKKRLTGDWIVNKNRKVTDVGIIPEDWTVKTFDELFTFLQTGTNARSDLSEQGAVNYIHYGDIHSKWRLFLDCDIERIPRISVEKITNLPFVEEGDLIIADASEDYAGIGTSVEVKNVKDKKIVCGLHTIFLRGTKKKIADGYKAYLTSIPAVKNSLIRKATGISVYGISKNTIKNTRIPLPTDIKEQTSIAKFLSDMNTEIEELERMRDKYRQLKSGMMQKLLTGRIRLKWKN